MTHTRRAFVSLAVAGAAAPRFAFAQAWPAKPIRAIVPFTAGSASDIVPRLVFDRLSMELGQPIVIDNRPGAGGAIGTAAVARAEPDGYTLLATASAHTINPSLYPDAPYDTVRDFSAVIPLGSLPNVLVVSPASGMKTLRDLVDRAKARAGATTYASVGVGSGSHFSAERLRLSAGFLGTHVPFKGGPDALNEVLAGRVDFFFCPIPLALPFVRDGRLLALAVGSPARATSLPDVPTTIEAGYPDSDFAFWIGVFAPSKTPAPVVDLLYQTTFKILQSTDMREKLARLGVDPMPLTPAGFDDLVKREIAANAAVVKAAGIKGDR